MSNRNGSEILPDRKSKVSLAMAINQGLGGPKPYPERERRWIAGQYSGPPTLFRRVTQSKRLGGLLDFRELGAIPTVSNVRLPGKTRRVKSAGSVP